MRNLSIYLGATCLVLPAGVQAQQADPNQRAYSYALRCFTANTVAVGDPRYNPNHQNDVALREAARRAYNAAQAMSVRLGYSSDRVAADITRNGYVEGDKMLRDDGYFQRTRADCIRLGML